VYVEGGTLYDAGDVPCRGALTIYPPTNRPHDISAHTIRQPKEPSDVTIYYCDIPTKNGGIVRPPKIGHSDLKKKYSIQGGARGRDVRGRVCTRQGVYEAEGVRGRGDTIQGVYDSVGVK
jgi:hypothetical protein